VTALYLTSDQRKWVIVFCGVLLVGALTITLRTWFTPIVPEVVSTPLVAPNDSTQPMVWVHVAGAVHHPGVYTVSPNARVLTAIQLAGGPSPAADLDAINLAARVKDGQRLLVPSLRPQGAESGTASASINQGSASSLTQISGIGPSMANRIVAYRNANGAFQSVDDLVKVSGIGPKTLSKLRDQIRL
jgi:competence protein ComEA